MKLGVKRQKEESVDQTINKTPKGKKQFIFGWSLTFNLTDLDDPIRNAYVPAAGAWTDIGLGCS